MALTDREKRDSSDLAHHLVKFRTVADVLEGRQTLLLTVGAGLLIAGVGGLLFRRAVHEELSMILAAMAGAGGLVVMIWREQRQTMIRAEGRASRLYGLARDRGYPIDHDGAYSEPDMPPDGRLSSPYGQ